MKRLITTLSFLAFSLVLFAQVDGDGYYRVSNVKTERYVYVTDNTGSIDIHAATADMGALELWKNHDRALSDPASVIYIEYKGSNSDSK